MFDKYKSALFLSARLKLTLGYTFFFAMMIIIFSSAFYGAQIRTIHQSQQLPERISKRVQTQFPRLNTDQHDRFSQELSLGFTTVAEELQSNLFKSIVLFDGFSILVCLLVSYYLAGMTLEPIEKTYARQQQFLQDASHELRTPLSVMRAEVDVALREGKKSSYGETLKSLQSDFQSITHLVEHILFLARTGENSYTSPQINTKTDLNKVAQKVVKKFTATAKQKKIELELTSLPKKSDSKTPQDSSLKVLGNSRDWEQVISILLDNAIKYTPSKGSVTLKFSRSKSEVRLAIIDTGVGMSKIEQEQIFNRFYRSDAARSTNGSGLGLAIARKIVDNLGGRLNVASKVGKGSVFTLLVPSIS